MNFEPAQSVTIQSSSSADSAPGPKTLRLRRFLLRLLSLLLLATCIGWILNRTGHAVTERGGVAGFGVGIVQGTLMPLALPNLVIGDDVNIYATNNTGRSYKLGYTAGVNLCGVLFFGFFSWRIRRWRKQDART